MRKVVSSAAVVAIAISVVSMGIRNVSPAYATVLDGFAINTEDKAVTVTLFTDQRAQYTTETHDKQFAIVLPDTEISKEQLENGLPVVIDNQNRFIGRAVPTDDGKVKIILPNLSANDYSVSIQQKRPGQTAASSTSPLKPRPAVQSSSQFEAVASAFPKAEPQPAVNAGKPASAGRNVVRLTPNPGVRSSNGTVWNPYVVKAAPAASPPALEALSASHPAPARVQSAPPVNTVSVAESGPRNAPPNDPLWYLHSLPPTDPAELPVDDLEGAAMDPAFTLEAEPAPVAAPAPIAQAKSAFAEIKEAIQALPSWLLITLGVFLAGIGLFGLIGGLVLLRLLFTQARNTQAMPPAYAIYPAMMASGDPPASGDAQPASGKSPYATEPEKLSSKLKFEDKASVNALDYLMDSPRSVSDALPKNVLLKFPSHKSSQRKRRLQAAR